MKEVVKFVLNKDFHTYTVRSPVTKIMYQCVGGQPFLVSDYRDVAYFNGRRDICVPENDEHHVAKAQIKSYTTVKPSAHDAILKRHAEEKAKRDAEAARNAAPAVTKEDPNRTEPRKPPTPAPVPKKEAPKKADAMTAKDAPKEAVKPATKAAKKK